MPLRVESDNARECPEVDYVMTLELGISDNDISDFDYVVSVISAIRAFKTEVDYVMTLEPDIHWIQKIEEFVMKQVKPWGER